MSMSNRGLPLLLLLVVPLLATMHLLAGTAVAAIARRHRAVGAAAAGLASFAHRRHGCRRPVPAEAAAGSAAARKTAVTAAFPSGGFRSMSSSSFRPTSLVLRERQQGSGGGGGIEVDDQGRRVRTRRKDGGGGGSSWEEGDGGDSWDDYGGGGDQPSSSSSSSSSWDDFDPLSSDGGRGRGRGGGDFRRRSSSGRSLEGGGRRSRDGYSSPPSRRGGQDDSSWGRGGGGGDRRRLQERGGGGGGRQNRKDGGDGGERRINMRALESAGFVHLYGLAPVRNALAADRRDFSRAEDRIDLDELDEESRQHELKQRERKPEAQFGPWLFVQEPKGGRQQRGGGSGGRSTDKSIQAEQVLLLAEERGIPVAEVDKGVLNTLSGNRPHQGFVLRCGKLDFEPLPRIPHPSDEQGDGTTPSFWLVLDEVVDPQNLGALLRSAYFLGGPKGKVGVVVCAKNSAPPSPTVAAASAGALELMPVYSTGNLPRTLTDAARDGFRIIGASSSPPLSPRPAAGDDEDEDDTMPVYDLLDLPPPSEFEPTILVLGSEGHGIRNLVARACTAFVRIPGSDDADGVDSLNVSVTGGILLWHLLQQQLQNQP